MFKFLTKMFGKKDQGSAPAGPTTMPQDPSMQAPSAPEPTPPATEEPTSQPPTQTPPTTPTV